MENFVLKAKSTIKRIAAISAGALMMGATVFGAAAAADYTLADYPTPFVTDGEWIGLLVVGADAASEDVAGAIGIAATMAQVATPGATATTTTIAGGKTKDVDMNTALSTDFGVSLDDSDLSGLQDTKLSIDIGSDKEYDIQETIGFGTTLLVETATTAASPDEDYEDRVFLSIGAGSINYTYQFDDTIDAGNYLANATDSDPIELTFAGRALTITGATATSLTVEVGEEVFLNTGDTVVIEGKTVELLNVGSSDNVVVSVDGAEKSFSGTKKVNGLKVKVKNTFDADDIEERSATLVIGTDAEKTYDNGDEWIGQPDTDYEWEWVISGAAGGSPVIAIKNAQTWDDADEVFYIGDKIQLDDFLSIYIDSLLNTEWREYEFDIETEELYNADNTLNDTSQSVLKLTCNGCSDEGLVAGTDETDTIYIATDGDIGTTGHVNVFWEDPDQGNHGLFDGSYNQSSSAAVDIAVDMEFDDTDVNIAVNGTEGTNFYVVIQADNQEIVLRVDLVSNDIEYIGDVDGDATSGDLLVGGVDVSTWDKDLLTEDGFRILKPETKGDADKLVIQIPSMDGADFEAKVIVEGPGTVVTTAGGAGAVSLGGVPVAKLDTEITDKTAYNMILIGGSAVNKLTAEAMGLSYPTYGAASGVPEGKGLLKLIDGAFTDGKVALVVAGWNAANTRDASAVLQDYQSFSLAGAEMEVTSTGGVVSVGPVTVAEVEAADADADADATA